MIDSPTGWIMFGLAALAAGFERWRSQKLLESSINNVEKSEYAQLLKGSRDEWMAKSSLEHTEFMAYRKETHDKATEIQSQFLQLNKENMELRARTDITQVMQTQQQILDTLGTMTSVLKLIEARLTTNQSS